MKQRETVCFAIRGEIKNYDEFHWFGTVTRSRTIYYVSGQFAAPWPVPISKRPRITRTVHIDFFLDRTRVATRKEKKEKKKLFDPE